MATLTGAVTGAAAAGTTTAIRSGIVRRLNWPFTGKAAGTPVTPTVKVWNGTAWVAAPTG